MEMNQNGINVDGFKEWKNVVCWPGEHLTRTIEIRNQTNDNGLCKIKGDTRTKQGFVIDGDMQFVLCVGFVGEGSCHSIVVSFLAPRNNALGVKKSLLVFDYEAIDFDYDEDYSTIESFLIVQYLYLHVGNPDNYKILKPSLPYARKRFGTGNLAGGAVQVFTWDWMDVALLHYLRGESMAYAGVLLYQDGSMKWRRQKKRA
jgi:hypothetical protein